MLLMSSLRVWILYLKKNPMMWLIYFFKCKWFSHHHPFASLCCHSISWSLRCIWEGGKNHLSAPVEASGIWWINTLYQILFSYLQSVQRIHSELMYFMPSSCHCKYLYCKYFEHLRTILMYIQIMFIYSPHFCFWYFCTLVSPTLFWSIALMNKV